MNKEELLRALEEIHDTICDIGYIKGRAHNRAIELVEKLQECIEKEQR